MVAFSVEKVGSRDMALTTAGLTNGGLTAHYQIKYDDSLSAADGRDRANALIAVCEAYFTQMTNWFGGIALPYAIPYEVDIMPGGGWSAGWGDGPPITLVPGNGASIDLVRFLLVAEVTEMFMLEQGLGWSPLASSEGSAGEGLSHFLATQLLISIGSPLRPAALADLWLDSPRDDYVNNVDFSDNSNSPKSACAVLFLYYLSTQLGFDATTIVGAGAQELAGVYANLTGDSGNPFPFFKHLLDAAFPSQTTSAVPGPNRDDPFPLGSLAFWGDKSTFGKDEVSDAVNSSSGLFPKALWLVLEGFSVQALAGATPVLSGAALGFSGISITPNASGPELEVPANPLMPQRIRFPFDIGFQASSELAFPASGDPPLELELDATITVRGRPFTAATDLEFVAGADPYFTNIDPAQDNVFYLSQDLRVFTATPSLNATPVPGGPSFGPDTVAGAYTYIQQLISHLNGAYSDPSGTDPFDPASHVLPGQSGALTGDSSVTPLTFSGFFVPHVNYNFALARVRLRGSQGAAGAANNVRVFFRLWSTQSADTDYQPSSTYASHLDAANLPDWPLPPADSHTIPFFATSNSPNFSDPGNPELGTAGVNNQTITITTGHSRWAYFGCFLNIYDTSNTVNGSPVQALMAGTHHCIVAQIAYDGAPIVNANGVTMSPENSDKLAQRNLQITHSDNPGAEATHRIPQTFDIRPSAALTQNLHDFTGYPDELMIDWGATPPGSVASIYWPQVNASQVLALASRLYATHELTAADANTLRCPVSRGVSYVPIPPGTSERIAGLFIVDLPPTVVKGQEFNIVIRRVASRAMHTRIPERGPQTPRLGDAAVVRAAGRPDAAV